jgi:hypothetical protein
MNLHPELPLAQPQQVRPLEPLLLSLHSRPPLQQSI